MTLDACEQYTYRAYSKGTNGKPGEELRIYESPLDDGKGVLFMVETADGEERASYTSSMRGVDALRDMREHVEGVRIARIRRLPIAERVGPRLRLSPQVKL